MIGNKVKALLELTNSNVLKFCKILNVLPPAMYRKLNKNTFKADELIKLAYLTGTDLAFIDKTTGKPVITFDISDIPDKKS